MSFQQISVISTLFKNTFIEILLFFQINFAAFDSTFEVDTPIVSAFEISTRNANKSEEEKNNQLDFQVKTLKKKQTSKSRMS